MMATSSDFYPHASGARQGGPETAFAAAWLIKEEAQTRRVQALCFVGSQRAYGATCDEVAKACGWEQWYSSRPRLSELRCQGKIIDSGWCRRGRSGWLQAVWVLTRYAVGVRTDVQGDLFTQLEAGS